MASGIISAYGICDHLRPEPCMTRYVSIFLLTVLVAGVDWMPDDSLHASGDVCAVSIANSAHAAHLTRSISRADLYRLLLRGCRLTGLVAARCTTGLPPECATAVCSSYGGANWLQNLHTLNVRLQI
jgi:hypothetical protein